MNIIEELSFATKKDFNKEWESIIWILANECGWSEEDILTAEIPFVFAVINGRTRMLKEQEKLSKRKK